MSTPPGRKPPENKRTTSNLPGFDYASHVIRTWSDSLLAQAAVWNGAWGRVEDGKYKLKHVFQDWAKVYRHTFEAYRDVATFETKSVEWQQGAIFKNQSTPFTFRVPARLSTDDVLISKMDLIGGPERGSVTIEEGYEVRNGLLHVSVFASDSKTSALQDGDQWVGFAYEKGAGGAPLGVILAMVDDEESRLKAKAEARQSKG